METLRMLVALAAIPLLTSCFASHGPFDARTDGGPPPPTTDGAMPPPPPPLFRDAGPPPPPPPPPRIDFIPRCERVCEHLATCGVGDPMCSGGCVMSGDALASRPECVSIFVDLLDCLEGVPCSELMGPDAPPECAMIIQALTDLGCADVMTGGG